MTLPSAERPAGSLGESRSRTAVRHRRREPGRLVAVPRRSTVRGSRRSEGRRSSRPAPPRSASTHRKAAGRPPRRWCDGSRRGCPPGPPASSSEISAGSRAARPAVKPNGTWFCQAIASSRSRGTHNSEHRTEALRQMKRRSRPDAEFDARAPQVRVVSHLGRSHQPCSPGCRRVRASTSGPEGGRISGPRVVRRSHDGPAARLRTASASWRMNLLSSYTDDSRMARLAAEHFWPECPKAGADQIHHGELEVRAGGDDDGVLPARLGVKASPGRHPREHPCCLPGAGQYHGVDAWVADEPPAGRAIHAGNELQDLAGNPRPPAGSASSHAVATVSGAGLRITAAPAARAARTPPAGMARGKFQGGRPPPWNRARNVQPPRPRSAMARSHPRSTGRSPQLRRPRHRPRRRSSRHRRAMTAIRRPRSDAITSPAARRIDRRVSSRESLANVVRQALPRLTARSARPVSMSHQRYGTDPGIEGSSPSTNGQCVDGQAVHHSGNHVYAQLVERGHQRRGPRPRRRCARSVSGSFRAGGPPTVGRQRSIPARDGSARRGDRRPNGGTVRPRCPIARCPASARTGVGGSSPARCSRRNA